MTLLPAGSGEKQQQEYSVPTAGSVARLCRVCAGARAAARSAVRVARCEVFFFSRPRRVGHRDIDKEKQKKRSAR